MSADHVYLIYAKRPRRWLPGHTWQVCHVASSKAKAQEWLCAAMERLPRGGFGWELHRHYRWSTMSLDNPYGSGGRYTPANAADIFFEDWMAYE